MKKSDQLKQERTAKKGAQQAIVDKAKAENRDVSQFNEGEQQAFDALTEEIRSYEKKIERAEIAEANEIELANRTATPVNTSVVDGEERERKNIMKRYSFHKAIRSQMPNGKLEGVEKEVHDETVKRAKAAGVAISGLAVPIGETRADGATVTQDSENYGGELVPTEQQGVIEFLRPKPILESLGARFITGLQGNLKFPTNDGGITGAWEDEVATTPNSKNAYGSKEMKPNRYGVRALLSLQNLIQSAPNLEQMTMDDIRAVIANAIDSAGINGVTSRIDGILNTTGTNSVVGGTNGAAPSWEHIVDMETGIYSANAEAQNMAYLINPATKGKLKKTKHSAGDLSYLMAMDNTINGYKVGVSNHVPGNLTKGTLSGTANAGVFGDFGQLLIGQWGFLDLSVDDKSEKKNGYVAIDVNTFLDALVRQPKAFSVIKDWDIS